MVTYREDNRGKRVRELHLHRFGFIYFELFILKLKICHYINLPFCRYTAKMSILFVFLVIVATSGSAQRSNDFEASQPISTGKSIMLFYCLETHSFTNKSHFSWPQGFTCQ